MSIVLKYTIPFILLMLLHSSTIAQLSHNFALGTNGSGRGQGHSIAIDKNDNIYVTGLFSLTKDFDPGPGVYNLTSAGAYDAFVYKTDAHGNFIWAKQFGGTMDDEGRSITTDNAGNIYVTGYFRGTADLDPGPDTLNLSSSGGMDIFICKLDPSGNLVWSKHIGGNGMDFPAGIVADQMSSFYLGGHFLDTCDVDPGPLSHLLVSSRWDSFICKFDTSGNLTWAKHITGNREEVCTSIAADSQGNVYACGEYNSTVDFDPGAGVYNLTAIPSCCDNQDVFVLKLDSAGNFIFARSFGGIQNEYGRAITVDINKNIYITGDYSGTADFDPGPGVYNLTPSSNCETYAVKLDPSGGFLWAKNFIGPATAGANGLSIAVDKNENAYITGQFRGPTDFDPGPGTYFLTSNNNVCYISELNASGNFVYAGLFGGHHAGSAGYDIATSSCGSVFITGTFWGMMDFDPGVTNDSLYSDGINNLFIVKLEDTNNLSFINNAIISAPSDASCSGIPCNLNILGGVLARDAEWYWYSDECGGTLVASGESITVVPDSTTTYFVRAESSCYVSDCLPVTVNINPSPDADFEIEKSADCNQVTVSFINHSTDANFYLWDFGDGTTSTLINTNHHYNFNSSSNILLIASNFFGCRDTATVNSQFSDFVQFFNIQVPNIFTPNDDDINDEFKPISDKPLPDCFNLKIYNRWGEKLFQSEQGMPVWDGRTNSGIKAVPGVYYCVIEFSGIQIKSEITLLE
jgi:gliding motility-associated-like protein